MPFLEKTINSHTYPVIEVQSEAVIEVDFICPSINKYFAVNYRNVFGKMYFLSGVSIIGPYYRISRLFHTSNSKMFPYRYEPDKNNELTYNRSVNGNLELTNLEIVILLTLSKLIGLTHITPFRLLGLAMSDGIMMFKTNNLSNHCSQLFKPGQSENVISEIGSMTQIIRTLLYYSELYNYCELKLPSKQLADGIIWTIKNDVGSYLTKALRRRYGKWKITFGQTPHFNICTGSDARPFSKEEQRFIIQFICSQSERYKDQEAARHRIFDIFSSI